MDKILIIGSYNGQESFGDKCLLSSVASNLRYFFGQKVELVSHIHDQSRLDKTKFSDIIFHQGLSCLYWRWHNKLRYLKIPLLLHNFIYFFLFPIFFIVAKTISSSLNIITKDIKDSSFLYFYGGTQLSSPWFYFNFLPLFYSLFICRIYKIPVFFGPQQYGPQTKQQRLLFRLMLNFLVTDMRARNQNCLKLAEVTPAELAYDEAFSCQNFYPNPNKGKKQKSYIMVNIREVDFTNQNTNFNKKYKIFSDFLFSLQQQTNLPFKLFQMSGIGFCDDTKFFKYLQQNFNKHLDIKILPFFKTGKELLTIMNAAYGTVSMSFHGCLFSLIAGAAPVPVISGEYYKYKYSDFQKYTGGQSIPFLYLGDFSSVGEEAGRVCYYFKNYSSFLTKKARQEAEKLSDKWYNSIKRRINK